VPTVLSRVSFEELYVAAQLVWADKKTAKEIAISSHAILDQVHKRKPNFYSGRRATALVSGLFYLLSFRFDSVKKQNELASKLGTTDVTIRASYRKWLIAFPDLFVDVIGKFAQDNSLKYFVLVDLKREPELH
jgi:transcription initiation factor TFIIIB Brf1 subunit/transcription initiation factor TFIIB